MATKELESVCLVPFSPWERASREAARVRASGHGVALGQEALIRPFGPPSPTGRRVPAGISRSPARATGFTLVEIMLAAMILGVGLLMLLPAFTVGVVESSQMVDASVSAQTAQTGEALCLTLLKYNDTNWWNGTTVSHADGNLYPYAFGGGINIVDDANIRVQGDPVLSHYYWSLLYHVSQFDAYRPIMVDLWVLACKRDTTTGPSNPTPGALAIQTAGVTGTAGSKTLSVPPNSPLLVPDTYVVTNTGEVLRISGVNTTSNTLTVNPAITSGFTSVFYVPNSAGVNACLFAISTKKAF